MKLGLKIVILNALICKCLGDIYVSKRGDDANDGSKARPVATLQAASELLQGQKDRGTHPIRIQVGPGNFLFSKTLELTEAHSGTPQAPIVVAGDPHGGTVITGAIDLPSGKFHRIQSDSPFWTALPQAARESVVEFQLSAFDLHDFGFLTTRGFGIKKVAPLEIFENGHPLQLARWPNADLPPSHTGSIQSDRAFSLPDSRPSAWKKSPDIWIHGLFGVDWADYHLPVSRFEEDSQILYLKEPPPQFGLLPNRPFYAYNVVEELDQPGEYYLDRNAGILLIWPLHPLSETSFTASILATELIRLSGAHDVQFQDLTIEGSRSNLVSSSSIERVTFTRCLFKNAGQAAVIISGSHSGVDHSEIVDTGEAGIQLNGGNRVDLLPGNNFVTRSRIHRTGRIRTTYTPGVHFNQGCGNRVEQNLFDDMPHSAILFWGNDHLINSNEIREVCKQTSDAAAIYTSRDIGCRGNVISHNFVHSLATSQPGPGIFGVYIDDGASGPVVSENIFYGIADVAINVGGGRDVAISKNIIARCGIAHLNDDRMQRDWTDKPGDSWNLAGTLIGAGINWEAPPWSTRFPKLATMPRAWKSLKGSNWMSPEGCSFSGNAGFRNHAWLVEQNTSGTGVFSVYADIKDNLEDLDPGITQPMLSDSKLRPKTLPIGAGGSPSIPFASIGLPRRSEDTASNAPPAPLLEAPAVSDFSLQLNWIDYSNMPWNSETGFGIDMKSDSGTRWESAGAAVENASSFTLTNIKPGRKYEFRIRATNRMGTSLSNVVSLETKTPPIPGGATVQMEAEDAYKVISEAGGKSRIEPTEARFADHGRALRLFDKGDEVEFEIVVKETGLQQLSLRLRTGSARALANLLPGAYEISIDKQVIPTPSLARDHSSLDPVAGGSFWGTIDLPLKQLQQGNHSVRVKALQEWCLIDRLSCTGMRN